MSAVTHIPVLLDEAIEALAVQPGGRYIDCTLGAGGHAAAILERSSPGGQLLGIDADPEAIKVASARLEACKDSALLVNDNFAHLQSICLKYDFFPVHGILLDLGLSSLQLASNERGFSFQHDAPLDMRFSPTQEITAADIINTFPESKLTHIIKEYGEEDYSHQIVRRIIQKRPIRTTLHLAKIIEQAVGGRRGRIHPATRTFQALRIAVNQELEHLPSVLKQALSLLGFEGRLVVISYHSLEDRIVKQFMQRESKGCICPPQAPVCVCDHIACLRPVNKRVITPSAAEVEFNPRSRSAKLRAAERITIEDDYHKAAEGLCWAMDVEAEGWRRPSLLKKLRVAFSAPQLN
ncbi:MAG: 16S rRNA (cytosine(1402)-N(4))-methyltransferase RsmH [Dehalococcoidia bacterium]|nr:MAG: 16S rRNA (cytosine(1402)-N(4))-methyltransferase RsmH [Dehalococcoidia bacterium]